MTANGIEKVSDQLQAAADQYGAQAAELEEQAKTLRDKQARVAAALVALNGARPKPAREAGAAPRVYRHFSAEDDAYIRANAGQVTIYAIAKHLGRDNSSVLGRARRLGLPTTRVTTPAA